MLVKNKTTSVISIPKTKDEENPGRLLPGVNEVSDSVWKEVAPSMAIHVDAGALELLELAPGEVEIPKGAAPESFPISGVAQKAALKLIPETLDRELLQRWADEEAAGHKRAKVLEALKKQLEAIAPGKPPAADDVADAGDEDLESEG